MYECQSACCSRFTFLFLFALLSTVSHVWLLWLVVAPSNWTETLQTDSHFHICLTAADSFTFTPERDAATVQNTCKHGHAELIVFPVPLAHGTNKVFPYPDCILMPGVNQVVFFGKHSVHFCQFWSFYSTCQKRRFSRIYSLAACK